MDWNTATAEDVAREFETGHPKDLPEDWCKHPVIVEGHTQMFARARDAEYPQLKGSGRGIVICGGGKRLFTNAYVCIRMLRYVGCELPIELWYLNDAEMDTVMRKLVEPYNVKVINADRLPRPRILNGWELKPFAIINSAFSELLLMDADNIAVRNPEYLFDDPSYKKCGATFWPDYSRLEEDRMVWKICDIPYNDEPEFESGQILIDRVRCTRELNLTVWLNSHSDFFYGHIHGDKETFHLAWKALRTPFAMPDRGIHGLDATMCQHDMEGKRIFQHRNMDKWDYNCQNRPVHGFEHEPQCRQFLAELRQDWNGEPWSQCNDKIPEGVEAQKLIQELTSEAWIYERVGHDQREMRFKPDGSIGIGRGNCEKYWKVVENDGKLQLAISGSNLLIMQLEKGESGEWEGRWLHFEKMPIRLKQSSKMMGSVILAFSHCCSGRRSGNGFVPDVENQQMLTEAILRANSGKWPVLIVGVGPMRMYPGAFDKITAQARSLNVIATADNPGHVTGAVRALDMAVKYARTAGFRYLVHVGDDCLMIRRDAIQGMIRMMDEMNLDYLTTPWISDDMLGTQVFACNVERMFVEGECIFESLDTSVCSERPLFHRMEATKRVWSKDGPSQSNGGYFHTHDPEEFAKKAEELGRMK